MQLFQVNSEALFFLPSHFANRVQRSEERLARITDRQRAGSDFAADRGCLALALRKFLRNFCLSHFSPLYCNGGFL